MVKRVLSRTAYTVVVLLLVLIAIGAVTPQGKAAARAALFIPQVLPSVPIKPQAWFAGDPAWRSVTYETAEGVRTADIIFPADADNNSAVLFFLGVVVNRPSEDSRVVALAEGLARAGMVVMIPWSETQLQQRIVLDDIEVLIAGFRYLQSLDEVDAERVGMGGICTGASMVAIAAQDDRIADEVKFVNLFAGYYDAEDFAKAIGARSRFYGDVVAPWETDGLTYRVFRNHLIEGVTEAAERDLLDRTFKQGGAITEGELAALSTEALSVFKLLQGAPYEEAGRLIEQLSPQTREFLRAASPSTNIEKLKARVLIMHDRADKLVPSEESRRMADALAGASNTYFTEFSLFQSEIQLHVADAAPLGPLEFVREAWKLYMHMYNIMRETS